MPKPESDDFKSDNSEPESDDFKSESDDSKPEPESEFDFNSVFMNLGVRIFWFYI